MRRVGVLLVSLVLLAFMGLLPAAAQTSTSTGFQTITVPQGYQFQVPADWITLPATGTPRPYDVVAASPDHMEIALGLSGHVSPGVAADPSRLAQEMLAGSQQYLQFLQQVSANTATSLAGPDAVQVTNADEAVSLTMSVSDAQGNTSVVSFRVALQGSTEYAVAVAAPQDVYDSDPDLTTILNSFALTAQSSAASLTPEEAILALLPYQLPAPEALPGYTVGQTLPAATPVTLAMHGESPVNTFNDWQQAGFVAAYGQALLPTADTNALPDARGSFHVWLFADATSAHALLMHSPPNVGGTAHESVPLGISLGDASGAAHIVSTSSQLPPAGAYEIHWLRGPLMFEVITAPQPLGQEHLEDAQNLASAIDNLEQAAPPLNLPQHTVTPPATELQRLQAALELKPFFIPGGATPIGYTQVDQAAVHPASEVAWAPDPAGMLQTVDTSWKRIISAEQTFQDQANHQVLLVAGAALDADAQGAAADLADDALPAGWTSTPIQAPLRLGDATVAFENTGANEESLSIGWTHGSLLIHVEMEGPPGTTSLDQLTAFAKQVEAHFQAVSLPTAGISGS
jgi:hypothetical protein